MEIKLIQLILRNFKGMKELTIDFSDVTNIYGGNATGKTTISDSFRWLLFDKDSKDRSKFDIQPLDENNNIIHMLDTEVEGKLEVDGITLALKKVLKEKWVKKRGEVEAELKGTETTYYINDVPVKKKEYQEKINGIIKEDIFKLITDTLYFSTNMKWQDRRKVLMDIIGDVTLENVISHKDSLRPLKDLLANKELDDFKKNVAASIKKLKKDKEAIPIRVDEANNSIKEIDFEALEFNKRGIGTAIKSLEEQILDSSKVNDEILKEKDNLYKLKTQLRELEYKADNDKDKPKREIQNRINELKMQIRDLEYSIRSMKNDKENIERDIEKCSKFCDGERNKWFEENQVIFEFDESSCICPTCKRAFEPEDIENKKQQLEENFNSNKAKVLKEIQNKGKSYKTLLEKYQEKLETTSYNIDSLNTDLEKLKTSEQELETEIKNFKPEDTLVNNQEYQDLKVEISELEQKLQQPVQVNNQAQELKERKSKLEVELEEVNSQLAYKEQNEILRKRIESLKAEEKRLAQQIAALEGQEYLCEEFIKTKVELLESSINNKFKYVSFKLFNTQVNGGIEETCEALINGVPFSNANTASQINAGIDIINALSNYYKVQAPIFIDNRESVNNLIETDRQVINLIVSKDKTLKIGEEVSIKISKEDKEYFNKKLEELKEAINDYSTGYIVEDLFQEAQHIKTKIVGQSRWSVQKAAYYQYKGFYFVVRWDDPATEMQDGQDTNCTIYEAKPTKKEVIEFI